MMRRRRSFRGRAGRGPAGLDWDAAIDLFLCSGEWPSIEHRRAWAMFTLVQWGEIPERWWMERGARLIEENSDARPLWGERFDVVATPARTNPELNEARGTQVTDLAAVS